MSLSFQKQLAKTKWTLHKYQSFKEDNNNIWDQGCSQLKNCQGWNLQRLSLSLNIESRCKIKYKPEDVIAYPKLTGCIFNRFTYVLFFLCRWKLNKKIRFPISEWLKMASWMWLQISRRIRGFMMHSLNIFKSCMICQWYVKYKIKRWQINCQGPKFHPSTPSLSEVSLSDRMALLTHYFLMNPQCQFHTIDFVLTTNFQV